MKCVAVLSRLRKQVTNREKKQWGRLPSAKGNLKKNDDLRAANQARPGDLPIITLHTERDMSFLWLAENSPLAA
ncbi:hypothetical protein BL250_17495 [Erwinia sp. OLTSP20]|nr:hypothetical protein BV501_18310 [Erwinia sp. OAMSP11]PIJ66638.1 hypothetical protein BK416_17540 [Erwinia sp. OLSSP12]PIJ78188.1 hypothetical protein BLD47_17410 [Erwinia sp. OLCASP19]PIJ79321.1 hypothetical protein BLD46_17285 [Erwinia sp. OLMTSP26]PIJ88281.1 hypothetical protein BL250_17495 [Erwinia sp. OLTSP20]PIJ88406.1 hypothetical protein BL249_17990 [Erwinia sp. OLFS4]